MDTTVVDELQQLRDRLARQREYMKEYGKKYRETHKEYFKNKQRERRTRIKSEIPAAE